MGPGSVVDGRYAVRREIARGAMGIVFEAVHEMLQATVALKTLTPAALEWPAGGLRLMREARVLARCKHPHVVGVHDAGTCVHHGPFVVLEMLEGRSLDSLVVARERLSVAAVARVGAQLSAALAYVHLRGFVHRDVKPSNAIVTRAAHGDSLHLIDFGIACLGERSPTPEPKLTSAGELLGTIEYMAPELVLQQAPASPESDVYALGALLFECLTRNVPFAGAASAIISAHAEEASPPRIHEQRPDVPVRLADAIMGAIAQTPAERRLGELATACADVLAETEGTTSNLLDVAPPSVGPRRQFPRVAYSAPARVITRSGAADGRTEDVSEGGVLVVVDAECAEGEDVTVRFPLPSSGRILGVQGVARWTRSQRGRRAVGVAFRNLPLEAAAELRSYAGLTTTSPAPSSLANTLWTG